ncbi:secretion-regulating guanine nucleotide exchange factor [Tasmannia lanceolata]|uniref:secretion-regulating guanine nucleotide exchange factor n=1 Tax=Tasmannia lanceolata TaxID=3420 RepID=UPI004064907B
MLKRVTKPTKPWHGVQKNRAAVLIALVLILMVLVFLLKNEVKHDASFTLPQLKWNSFRSSVQFQPSLEFMNATDVIWQIPKSAKAVLFLAHGCNGRAANFWDRSPSCPNCVGLPEERLIVLHALERKFAVLTISSTGKCWTFGKEKKNVKGIIKWWIAKHKLEKLPLTALGASSGGHFVSALATEMRFSSIALMIAEGVFDAMDIPRDYPPTLFVHMPKDHSRMRRIGDNMKALKEKGISVAEVKCLEFPLTPNLLSDRIPGLDQTISIKLFNLFIEKGFIDEKGYMKNDGRGTRWKKAVKEGELSYDKLEWINHIQEELNLAFGYHEMTSLQSEQILNWFESHMS